MTKNKNLLKCKKFVIVSNPLIVKINFVENNFGFFAFDDD